MNTPAIDTKKLKVFISYSRQDLVFADQLVAFLEWQGFQAIIDRKGIHGAEKWEERLGQLILEAELVVFVLSPASATSDVCAWEVEEAHRRRKRIIPVLCRPLDGIQPPQRLRDLNYIYFYPERDMPGSGFATGQIRLVDALSVDVEWLREHTRLEELAARWEANGRPVDQLVRGSELAQFKAWRDQRPSNAPQLTDMQRYFLGASEDAEAAREDAEREKLEEMAAAQAAREAAIEEREVALKEASEAQSARARAWRVMTWGSLAVAFVIAAGALAFSAIYYNLTQEAQKERTLALTQKAAVDELIRRIRVGRSNRPGIAAMKKICAEAAAVTETLASTARPDEFATKAERFWELYYGAMNLIEIRQRTDDYKGDSAKIVGSAIEAAMVGFGDALKRDDDTSALPRTSLEPRAADIKKKCGQYLP
jgi:TIR domain